MVSAASPPSKTVPLALAVSSDTGTFWVGVGVGVPPGFVSVMVSEPSNASGVAGGANVSIENDTKLAPDDTEPGPPDAGSTDWSVVIGKAPANCDAETSCPGPSS